MQTVSNAWKENQQRTIVNEGFVEVSIDIADPDAIADATSHDNGASYLSTTPQVVREGDRNIAPYATLEQNMWVLDGGRKMLPLSDFGDGGYIGDVVCGSDGIFRDKIPVITVWFTRVHSNLIPGVTIVWSNTYGEFARDFVVTAYNDLKVVAKKEVRGNADLKSVVLTDITGYDRIEIAVWKWCLPYHRARIEEIFVGVNKVYDKSDLFDYTHDQTVDPVASSLPKAGVSFSVNNIDGSYNPYNTEGLTKYLMERQEIKTRYGYKVDDKNIEWVRGGTFYLSEWNAPQNGISAEFKARDLLEFMFADFVDEVPAIAPRSLGDIATIIFRRANLPLHTDGRNRWYIDPSLFEITTTGVLPVDTMANCLLMVANAAGCTLCQDREGTLRIEPLLRSDTDYKISLSNSYKKAEMSLSKPLKNVVTKVYSYTTNENGEVESTSYDMEVTFGTTGETVTVDNPLITDDDRAVLVAEAVGNYLQSRITLDSSWRPDVRLDALDKVNIENSYGDSNVIVTDVKYTFNGSFRGECKGRVI